MQPAEKTAKATRVPRTRIGFRSFSIRMMSLVARLKRSAPAPLPEQTRKHIPINAQAMPVGKTADRGWQIGVRRAYPGSPTDAWKRLLSPAGIRAWLGGSGRIVLEKGRVYKFKDGTTGEVRVMKPGEVIRVTWQPPDWPAPSTIQVRVLQRAGGLSTIAFHQECLPDAAAREAMRERWLAVLAELGTGGGGAESD